MFRKETTRRENVGTFSTVLDGVSLSYTLKRGPRCRRMRLEVTREAGLTAIIPRRYDLKRLPAFLAANKRWIFTTLKKYTSASIPGAETPASARWVPYLGNFLEIVRESNGHFPVRMEGGKIIFGTGNGGDDGSASPLRALYRNAAELLIRGKATSTADRMGLTYGRLTLKEMRTRWGSCSLKGNLNFNWRLILMPEPVIDYVVTHELAHLKEMNHGPAFWACVARECPEWRERRRWLTRNGREYIAAFERALNG